MSYGPTYGVWGKERQRKARKQRLKLEIGSCDTTGHSNLETQTSQQHSGYHGSMRIRRKGACTKEAAYSRDPRPQTCTRTQPRPQCHHTATSLLHTTNKNIQWQCGPTHTRPASVTPYAWLISNQGTRSEGPASTSLASNVSPHY